MKRRLLFLMLSLFSSVVATDGLLQIGYGVPSKAMGGVGIAWPLDGFVVAHNPAGLVKLRPRFDLAGHLLRQYGALTLSGENTVTPDRLRSDELYGWPEGALVIRPNCSQSWGLAFYEVGSWVVDYKRAVPEYGTTPLRASYFQFALTPAWSIALLECHAVGIALNITLSRLELEGLQALTSIDPSHVTNQGGSYSPGVSVRIGWLFTPWERLMIGATFQTRTYSSPFEHYRGFLPEDSKIELPPQLGFGVRWRLDRDTVFAIDIVKLFWHVGKAFENQLTAANQNRFGADDGPGFGWDDQLLLKAGFEWLFLPCLRLRVGYNHCNTSIAPQDGFLNALNMQGIESHFTFGASWTLCMGHELHAYYLHGFRHTIAGALFPGFRTSLVMRQNGAGFAYAKVF